MLKLIKDFVRRRPALYDRVRNLKRSVLGAQDPAYGRLREFSHSHRDQVNFIQIGANDGLRNDPLRPFIVRHDWQGVLVEPLPTVFPLLQRNYAYLQRPQLVFLNAAVTVEGEGNLEFWSVKQSHLDALPLEQRLDFQRKASFNRGHVAGFLPAHWNPDQALEPVPVPCLGLEQIIATHLPRKPLHLLVIDVEGYESTLIPGLDFSRIRPEAVFFETEHLGADKQRVFDHLGRYGYRIDEVGLDAMAVREGS